MGAETKPTKADKQQTKYKARSTRIKRRGLRAPRRFFIWATFKLIFVLIRLALFSICRIGNLLINLDYMSHPYIDINYSQSTYRHRESIEFLYAGNNSPLSLVERLSIALKRVDFQIPENTRFDRYIKKLSNINADHNVRINAQQEILFLLTGLERISNIHEWMPTIRESIVYEADFPSQNVVNTRGRDSLFEIFIAGRLNATGIKISRGEPDILCYKEGFEFGVAAKRIKSKNQILKRVKDARSQIERSGVPGVIALDLTPLQENYFKDIPIESAPLFFQKTKNFLDQNFEPLLPEIQKKCIRKHVFGVIAFVTMGALSDNGSTILMANHHSGHRLCLPNTIHARHMYELVHLLNEPCFSI